MIELIHCYISTLHLQSNFFFELKSANNSSKIRTSHQHQGAG